MCWAADGTNLRQHRLRRRGNQVRGLCAFTSIPSATSIFCVDGTDRGASLCWYAQPVNHTQAPPRGATPPPLYGGCRAQDGGCPMPHGAIDRTGCPAEASGGSFPSCIPLYEDRRSSHITVGVCGKGSNSFLEVGAGRRRGRGGGRDANAHSRTRLHSGCHIHTQRRQKANGWSDAGA